MCICVLHVDRSRGQAECRLDSGRISLAWRAVTAAGCASRPARRCKRRVGRASNHGGFAERGQVPSEGGLAMGTTPQSFYEAFVVPNLEDYLSEADDIRKGFNASVSAFQLAD